MRGAFASALLPASILLASCSSEVAPPEQTGSISANNTPLSPLGGSVSRTPQVSDFPSLESRECREVAQFYLTAVQEQAFDRAALVWDDPVIDGARLEALFVGYSQPQFTIRNLTQEGAAGSSYCTVTASLVDGANLSAEPQDGELVLHRVNDVPGATPEQLRWTLRLSTFAETMERSSRQ